LFEKINDIKEQTKQTISEINENIVNKKIDLIINDVEEFTSMELREATKELELATLAVEKAETSKDRLDASVELKKANARVQGINYLSKKF
jgi:uncharacterized membrane protein YdfJ with MMPL/SSD domain